MDKNDATLSARPRPSVSLWLRIVDFLLGRDADSSGLNELRLLNKSLEKNGCRYYTFRKDRIKGTFAEVLYSCYKAVAPLREFFLQNNTDDYYKALVITYTLSPRQREIAVRLSPEELRRQADAVPLKELAEQGKAEFVEFRKEFTADLVNFVNNLYASVLILKQFCTLDFYAVLKRFSPDIKENTFTAVPSFVPLTRQYAVEFCVDFCNAASVMLNVKDWGRTFSFLETAPGFRDIDRNEFNQMVLLLYRLSDRKALDFLPRVLTRNADYEVRKEFNVSDIVVPYTDVVLREFKTTMADMVAERRQLQLQTLLERVFGDAPTSVLKNYTGAESSLYQGRGVGGFEYCNALNYLSAFFACHLRTSFTDFISVFGVQGRCLKHELSNGLSEGVHELQGVDTEIVKFDQGLSSKFPLGYQLKNLLEVSKRDENARAKLMSEIAGVNATARTFLTTSLGRLEEMADGFEDLLDDRTRGTGIVENWREVDARLRNKSQELLEKICESTRAFLQLMDNFPRLG